MSDTNVPSGEYLTGVIERVEALRARKKDIAADEAAVWAEVRANGYNPKILKNIIRKRELKPSDRAEFETLTALYEEATGLQVSGSLFAAVGAIATDVQARSDVIRAYSQVVPDAGDLILRVGSVMVRLWRDGEGEVRAEDWLPPEPAGDGAPGASAPGGAPGRRVRDVPDVDAAGAEALGRQAWRDDKAITSNPFPAGDVRRREFDRGWRAESGTDGMGGPADSKGDAPGDGPETPGEGGK